MLLARQSRETTLPRFGGALNRKKLHSRSSISSLYCAKLSMAELRKAEPIEKLAKSADRGTKTIGNNEAGGLL